MISLLNLSEGEFVMPADVVRFHGLDKMMALRDEAKDGTAAYGRHGTDGQRRRSYYS